MLASDIAVHREQLDRNVDFFLPDDILGLADLLRRYRDIDPKVQPIDYEMNKHDFAKDLLRMLREVARDTGAIPE